MRKPIDWTQAKRTRLPDQKAYKVNTKRRAVAADLERSEVELAQYLENKHKSDLHRLLADHHID